MKKIQLELKEFQETMEAPKNKEEKKIHKVTIYDANFFENRK